MNEKKSAYSLRLYNTLGKVSAISRSKGVEIYYKGTLKYPGKFIDYIPPYSSEIQTTKQKYYFIKSLIKGLEKRRLSRNEKARVRAKKKRSEQDLYKDELLRLLEVRFEEEQVKKVKKDEKKLERELGKKEERERIAQKEFEIREAKKIILTAKEIEIILYGRKKRVRALQLSKATRFKIKEGTEELRGMTSFPPGYNVEQKKKFLKNLLRRIVKKVDYDVFESDVYWVYTREKKYAEKKRWTLRYKKEHLIITSDVDNLKKIREKLSNDFKNLLDEMWPFVADSRHYFIIKNLINEYDDKDITIERRIPFKLGKDINREVVFSRMPSRSECRFWEKKGFEVARAKDSAMYRYAVFEKVTIPKEKRLIRNSGFGSITLGATTKKSLMGEYNRFLNDFDNKMRDYIGRKFVTAITLNGFFIELELYKGYKKRS